MGGKKVSSERFARLMSFLKDARIRVEKQTSSLNQASSGGNQGKSITQFNVVTGAVTLTTSQHSGGQSGGYERKKKERNWNPCLGCNVDGCTDLRFVSHPMDTCSVWNSLSVKGREKKAKFSRL